MIHRWRREMIAGTVGALGSTGATLYADLPEGPSLVPLLAAAAVMSAVIGLLAGASTTTGGARRVVGGLMVIVLASMRPFDMRLEHMMGGPSLAGNFMAGPSVLISFAVGWVSISLGSRFRDRHHQRASR